MGQLGKLAAQALYLFSPLLAAAVLAGLIQRHDRLTWLKRPIDGGATFRGHRVFGDNKTWRGVACALVGCIAMVWVQKSLIGDRAGLLAVIDYQEVNPFVLGVALGLGAILGELPNSFVKRQLGIAPGHGGSGIQGPFFYLWDQVDFLTTTWPLLLFWIKPGWSLVLMSFVLTPAVHQLISLAGYLIGARRQAV